MKCRWSPPARPVMPLFPSVCPFSTASPAATSIDGQVRVERLHAHAVIDDDAVAVDAQLVGEQHLPRPAATIGVLAKDARSKPRCTCWSTSLAPGRCRCAGRRTPTPPRIRERMKTAPCQSISGDVSRANDAMRLGVLAPQFAVDRDELLDSEPVGATSVVPARMAGTTRSRNASFSSMRLAREGFGNTRRSNCASRGVAGLVAREERIGVVIGWS